MADATTVLRANGILIPEVMLRAAQLENVEPAVAAAILEGESGGGRNIWGHDTTVTAGTYSPGAPVTQSTYLAYRAAMRAGRIKRNGAGPCQATSAQYQDVADALGGCWDPLANCRSGFRGMGALIKAYGVQQGARRYNGSGPDAETYGQRFLTRYQRWAGLLAAATPTTASPVAETPTRKGLPLMLDRAFGPGDSAHRIVCPTGTASALVAQSWLSASVSGDARVQVWAQRYGQGQPAGSSDAAHAERDWALHSGDRQWFELPSGTEYVTVHVSGATGPGGILIEQRSA